MDKKTLEQLFSAARQQAAAYRRNAENSAHQAALWEGKALAYQELLAGLNNEAAVSNESAPAAGTDEKEIAP